MRGGFRKLQGDINRVWLRLPELAGFGEIWAGFDQRRVGAVHVPDGFGQLSVGASNYIPFGDCFDQSCAGFDDFPSGSVLPYETCLLRGLCPFAALSGWDHYSCASIG